MLWLAIGLKMDLTENQRECMHAVKISPNYICALCTYISRAQFSASSRPVRFAQCSTPEGTAIVHVHGKPFQLREVKKQILFCSVLNNR